MEPAEAAVKVTASILKVFHAVMQIDCCRLTACRSCVDRDEPRSCPSCLAKITRTDFKVDLEMVRFLEAAKLDWRHWKEQACFLEETDKLREVLRCKLCGKACSKAVSLICCASASCRKCALSKLKEDKQWCWNCGRKSVNVITPSQLVNNYQVRAGVKYIIKEGKVTKNSPFIVFLLLHISLQKARSDRDIDGTEQLKIETKKISKAKAVNVVPPEPKTTPPQAKAVNVVAPEPKTTPPQVQTNKGTLPQPAEAFNIMRVPHTYNGILTVIATVRVPVSPSL